MYYRDTYCDGFEYHCEFCARDWEEKIDSENFVDSPLNCAHCHCPLDYSLTPDGIEYVLDAMRESLRVGKTERDKIHDCYNGTYYEGSRHCEIVRDWAEHLRWYGLDNRTERFIELYLSRTEE